MYGKKYWARAEGRNLVVHRTDICRGKNPHKRSSPPANIWPSRLGRTILWGLMPVIYHLLVQNEPVNWLIVLRSNGAHWGLIYMHAGWVCDQLPVNHQFATAMVWWISVKHICTLLCVHFCFSLTHSSHWVCVLYLYLGVWDETLTPHMYKHSGRLQHVIKLIRSQKKARYYKWTKIKDMTYRAIAA